MIKVIINGCCENEQIGHVWSIDIIIRKHSLKVAHVQSWFQVLAANQTYLENDKCKFDETNGISS